MLGNQCVTTDMDDFVLRINPTALIRPAILGKRDFVIDSHRIDQLAMPGAFPEIGSTCTCDPITYLCHFDDVALLGSVLAFRQSADSAKRVGSKPKVVIDDVREESGHFGCSPM